MMRVLKEFKVKVVTQDGSTTQNVKIKVEIVNNSMNIELINELEPDFFYYAEVNSDNFSEIKSKCSLRIDFERFFEHLKLIFEQVDQNVNAFQCELIDCNLESCFSIYDVSYEWRTVNILFFPITQAVGDRLLKHVTRESKNRYKNVLELKDEMKELKLQLEKSQQDSIEANEYIARKEKELKLAKEADVSNLITEHEVKVTTLKRRQEETVKELKDKINKQDQLITNLRSDLQQETMLKQTSMEQKMSKTKDFNLINGKYNSLKKEIEEVKRELMEKNIKLQAVPAKDEKIKTLEEENLRLVRNQIQQETESTCVIKNVEKLNANIEVLTTENTKLKENLGESTMKKARLEEKVRHYNTIQNECARLKEEAKTSEEWMVSKKKEVETLSKEAKKLKAENEVLKEKLKNSIPMDTTSLANSLNDLSLNDHTQDFSNPILASGARMNSGFDQHSIYPSRFTNLPNHHYAGGVGHETINQPVRDFNHDPINHHDPTNDSEKFSWMKDCDV